MFSKRTLSALGEFGLIELLAKFAPYNKSVLKGIGDDTAVLNFNGKKLLLLTADMIVEDVHFTKAMGAKAIGRKALACNLSDIAAMGGVPLWAVVSIGLPKNLKSSFVLELYQGMNALASKFSTAIVGGDTVSSDKVVINVALVGKVSQKELILRSGARSGDFVFTTGPLGRSFQSGKHLWFTPRLAESRYLVKNFAPTSMIDISDGLAADLNHILKASRVGAVLYEVSIPKTKNATTQETLSDGEDFELLFTLSPQSTRKLLNKKHPKELSFYKIGEITRQKGLMLITPRGTKKKLKPQGFVHF